MMLRTISDFFFFLPEVAISVKINEVEKQSKFVHVIKIEDQVTIENLTATRRNCYRDWSELGMQRKSLLTLFAKTRITLKQQKTLNKANQRN